MKRLLLLCSLLALAAAGTVTAQEPQPQQPPQAEPPPPPPPVAEPATEISEAELETFVEIYVDLQETAAQFESEMAGAETQEQAQEAQERMRDESISAIESHGWTLDMYNSVAQAINSDPELIQEALQLIEDRS